MSFVGKNTNNLLEMQCCKRPELKKEKKFVFCSKAPSWKDKTTAISADTFVATELFYFL